MSQVQLPPVFRGHEIYSTKAQGIPWHIADVKLQDYWERINGEGVLVGIADTGIDEDHPDIRGRIDYAEAFARSSRLRKPAYWDGNDHGTHVATTIAVMAPKCRFAIAKVLSDNGSGNNNDVAKGIIYLADKGCHIINLSLGSPYDDPTIRDAVNYAKSKGCIMVIATGNEGANAVGFPAQHGVGIGAIDRGRKLAYFSNRGKNVDLVGYGVDIVAGVPGSKWQSMSGTSMATPWIAGIAANRLSAEIKAFGEVVTKSDADLLKLEAMVTDLGPEGRDLSYGRGMPDIERAFSERLNNDGDAPADSPKEKVVISVTGRDIGIAVDGPIASTTVDANGNVIESESFPIGDISCD